MNRDAGRARWLVPLALLALLVALHSPVFFGGRTLIPLANRAELERHPAEGPGDAQPETRICIDPGGGFMSSYAWDAYAVVVYRSGGVPLWNPYNGLGQPLLQNGLSAAVHPSKLLQIALPPATWDLVFLVAWWLCAWFVSLWARELGARPLEGFLAGALIVCSSHFALYLLLRDVVITCAAIPLVLYGVERTLREPGWRWRHFVLGGGLFAVITGGQASVILVFVLVFPVYLGARLLMERERGIVALAWVLVPGLLAGVLLSAPHWLNFVDHAFGESYSTRDEHRDHGMSKWPLAQAGGLLFPWLGGRLFELPFDSFRGWDWNMFPGWFASVQVFAATGAVVGLVLVRPSLRGSHRTVLLLLAVLGVFIFIKVLGIPPVSYLGRMPGISMSVWPRYATPVALILLAAVTPFVLRWLWRQSRSCWGVMFAVWLVLVVAAAAWSFAGPWRDATAAGPDSEEAEHLRVFLTSGLVWAMAPAAALFCYRMLRMSLESAILVAIFALALQAVAAAPFGYDFETYGRAWRLTVSLFVGLAGLVALVERFGARWVPSMDLRRWLPVPGLIAVGLSPLLLQKGAEHSLPGRYDPLATAPYMDELERRQEGERYRHFAVEGTPGPNFALPHFRSGVNVMECLLMYWSAKFVDTCIDPGSRPYWFAGDYTLGRTGTTFGAFERFRPWYDFASIRFFQTRGAHPGGVLEENWRAGEPRRRLRFRRDESVEQAFRAPGGKFERIDLLLSDDHHTSPGTLILEVIDDAGAVLGTLREPARRVADRVWHPFVFEPPLAVEPGAALKMRVSYEPPGEGPKGETVAYYAPRTEGKGALIYRIPNLTGTMPVVYRSKGGNMTMWENEGAKARVFRVPAFEVEPDPEVVLARLPERSREEVFGTVFVDRDPRDRKAAPAPVGDAEIGEGDALLAFELSPNEVRFRYRAADEGVLVVSDSYHRDWRARVNDELAPVLRVNAAFRGLYVPEAGVYEVAMSYRPRTWTASLIFAALGVLLAGGMTVMERRPRVNSVVSD